MFDFSKTYANKKGLVAALRKAEENLDAVVIDQDQDGRWVAAPVLASAEPTREFDLTENEFHAAMVLVVNDCLRGMGGERPADLENDEYTWVYADTLVKFGWSKESAAGTFSALDAKGVILEYEKGQMVLDTAAWKWLDTKWSDETRALAVTKRVEKASPVAKPAKAPKVAAAEQNGIKAPRAGGLCAQAWAMFDRLGTDVDVKAALAEGRKLDLNDNNIRTELCRWRKFHGIAARKAK